MKKKNLPGLVLCQNAGTHKVSLRFLYLILIKTLIHPTIFIFERGNDYEKSSNCYGQ